MRYLPRWLAILGPALLTLGALSTSSAAGAQVPKSRTETSQEAPAPLLGKPLAEALLALEVRGLRIVFSDRVVQPEMRVLFEPGGETPREILNALLAPHGLEAEEGARGTLVVVRGSAAGGGPSGNGEAEELAPSRYFGDEIVVRPSEWSVLQEEPSAPMGLSRKEVEALPHLGDDIFRALSLFPGVSANDATATLTIHGGRRDEVQIVLDGQELYDAFHLKDFDSAVSIVPAEGLSGVSLSTGAFPASSGDRMSGVLELTTRRPDRRRNTRLGLSLLNAQASSSGLFAGEQGSWLLSARRGSIDLATRLLGREDPSFWDAFFKGAYQATEAHRFSAHYLIAADKLAFSEAADGEDRRFSTDYGSTYLWLTHQALLSPNWLVESAVSRSAFDRDRRGEEREEEKAFAITDLRDVEVLEASQSWIAQVRRHTLEWGFQVRRFEATYDYESSVEPALALVSPFEAVPTGEADFRGAFRGEHLGIYAADRLTVLDPLTVELGLRYDRHTLTGDTLVSPRVNLAWRLGQASVVRASWGHFFQTQRPYELEVQDGETRFSSAERSVHSVLAYERLLNLGGSGGRPWLTALRLELYHRDIDHPRPRFENTFEALNIFPEIEGGRVRLEPITSRARGVELVLRGHAGRRLDWWLNYAVSRVEDRLETSLEGTGGVRQVPRKQDQPQTLNLSLQRRFGRHWTANLAWRFHTGWPTTPVTLELFEGPDGEDPADGEEAGESEVGDSEGPIGALVLGPLHSDRLTDYHRLDLRASRSWELRTGRLTFFLDVQNLLDRKNLAGFDLSVDEETETLAREREVWAGILPSLGLSWEF